MSVTRIRKDITNRLEGMLDRNKAFRSFLVRNILPMYQNTQRKRWMSENTSEGKKWDDLNSDYARAKLTRFKEYPGRGKRMLVATNRLFESVIGPGADFRMVVTDRSLTIRVGTPYAFDVNAERPFDEYSEQTRQKFRKACKDFIIKNQLTLMNEFL